MDYPVIISNNQLKKLEAELAAEREASDRNRELLCRMLDLHIDESFSVIATTINTVVSSWRDKYKVERARKELLKQWVYDALFIGKLPTDETIDAAIASDNKT